MNNVKTDQVDNIRQVMLIDLGASPPGDTSNYTGSGQFRPIQASMGPSIIKFSQSRCSIGAFERRLPDSRVTGHFGPTFLFR
jgi:hypothetical protein